MMYFFPRLEYSKENLFKKQLSGSASKVASGGVDDMEEDALGFDWDPSRIVPSCLTDHSDPMLALPSMTSTSSPLPGALSINCGSGNWVWDLMGYVGKSCESLQNKKGHLHEFLSREKSDLKTEGSIRSYDCPCEVQ